MEYRVKSSIPAKQRSGCMVIGIYESRKLGSTAKQINQVCDGQLAAVLKHGDMDGKPGKSLMLYNLPGLGCERVLLVGCGKEKKLDAASFGKIFSTASKTLEDGGTTHATFYLSELTVKGWNSQRKISQAIVACESARYRFDQLKSKSSAPKRPLKSITLNVDSRDLAAAKHGLIAGQAIANGMGLTRDLSNLPGNICTPSYLASQARKLGKQHSKLSIRILEEAEMKKLGMGALLSVSRGSRQPAKLITLDYKGARKSDKPVVLVGKGLTFDAGGISIKPAQAMDEMKYDMCGGATVMGVMCAVAEIGLPINLVGVIPSSENLPDGDANKPGDIVTSMSGQTIEILNTDAEGRLILCDALTYCARYKPDVVIDLATLTGACIVALGHQTQAVLGNNEPLIKDLLKAGEQVGDRAWQLPLWEEYQQQLDSNFADMANIGGRTAGTITAACFLSRYTKDYNWAHMDIAGTAWVSGANKGATGRPVPLLMQYLIDRAG
ncbi:MAG TPA: leucyl aminopeptidase [Gammaproteobacteria bacterium]|nr:leucyl aminopeptidase [Gammaproteobacteria bacterium]